MLNNENISKKSLMAAALPSFIVLIISIFFDFLYQFVLNFFYETKGQLVIEKVDVINLWLYPIVIYGIFIFCLLKLTKIIDKKLKDRYTSETEIIKTIEKWSGIVDGIGTALPLIGAAVILFTVGLGKEYQYLFLEIAVPFEIKSLFILAAAKLFESVFDDFEIQIQNLYDKSNGKLGPEVMKDTKIEFVNLPDAQMLDDINKTIDSWNETVNNMKDPVFEKNLEKILKITGKS